MEIEAVIKGVSNKKERISKREWLEPLLLSISNREVLGFIAFTLLFWISRTLRAYHFIPEALFLFFFSKKLTEGYEGLSKKAPKAIIVPFIFLIGAGMLAVLFILWIPSIVMLYSISTCLLAFFFGTILGARS